MELVPATVVEAGVDADKRFARLLPAREALVTMGREQPHGVGSRDAHDGNRHEFLLLDPAVAHALTVPTRYDMDAADTALEKESPRAVADRSGAGVELGVCLDFRSTCRTISTKS